MIECACVDYAQVGAGFINFVGVSQLAPPSKNSESQVATAPVLLFEERLEFKILRYPLIQDLLLH